MKILVKYKLRILSLLIVGLLGCVTTSEQEAKKSPAQADGTSISEEFSRSGKYVVIDSRLRSLTVYQGERELLRLAAVAFGTGGVGLKQRVGDQVTPKGSFRIGWKHHSLKFHRFIGLDYPSQPYLDRGLAAGIISTKEFDFSYNKLRKNKTPSQNTRLGGQIGLHGIGLADPTIHPWLNWTNGCIAVTNDEIDELYRLLSVGDLVHIR